MTPPPPKYPKAHLLVRIDRTLPTLPRDRQNLVACYALGLRDGLRLRERTPMSDAPEACPEPVPFPSESAKE
jgi:hypothetical protein